MTEPLLLVEDEPRVARHLARFLQRYRPVVQVATVASARREIDERPRLFGAVVDFSLPDGTALDVIDALHEHPFEVPVLVLTGRHDPATINAVHVRGAEYAVKPASPSNLTAFVARLQTRHERVAAALEDAIAATARERSLTPAERRILSLTARGASRQVLAEQIGVTENTLKSQIRALLRKCDEADELSVVVRQIWQRAIGAG